LQAPQEGREKAKIKNWSKKGDVFPLIRIILLREGGTWVAEEGGRKNTEGGLVFAVDRFEGPRRKGRKKRKREG